MFYLINDTRTIVTNIGSTEKLFRVVTYVFISINSTVNPVIYATQDRRFRRHMWRLVTSRCRSRNNKVFLHQSGLGACATVSGAGVALQGVGIECKLPDEPENHYETCNVETY